MQNEVTCSDCSNFIPCQQPSSEQALGLCFVLKSYEDRYKRSGNRMPPHTYDEAFKKLGNKLFWPKLERYCEKFKGV